MKKTNRKKSVRLRRYYTNATVYQIWEWTVDSRQTTFFVAVNESEVSQMVGKKCQHNQRNIFGDCRNRCPSELSTYRKIVPIRSNQHCLLLSGSKYWKISDLFKTLSRCLSFISFFIWSIKISDFIRPYLIIWPGMNPVPVWRRARILKFFGTQEGFPRF